MHRALVLIVGVCLAASLSAGAPAPGSALPSGPPLVRASLFTTIQGNALDSNSGSLPDSLVRLRDARSGRIVDTQLTDKAGLFAFRTLDPGSYIVEIISSTQTVLAASQLLSVNAGEAVSAVVKLPFRIEPFGGLLGHSAAQALAVMSAAASSGVLTTAIASARQPVSP